ncbi:hypothetical protein [uncultured Alsobacter sp.]|uniref:hypothetical protein n=1 Tax=uncultured Alsobacter sp. TaxID=1748258 RepID=UPI0026003530|nr:hypothetical protein [uncultured Alsobacter sp.]
MMQGPEWWREAENDLDMLHGRGRHAHPGNVCWNDGIYARSLEQKWHMRLPDLEKRIADAKIRPALDDPDLDAKVQAFVEGRS